MLFLYTGVKGEWGGVNGAGAKGLKGDQGAEGPQGLPGTSSFNVLPMLESIVIALFSNVSTSVAIIFYPSSSLRK